MTVLYDDIQLEIAAVSRRLLHAKSDTQRVLGLLDQQGADDYVFWTSAVSQGWTAITIPEEFGGLGLGLLELGLIAQASGATLVGAPFLTAGHGAAQALLHGASQTVKRDWLCRLASGDAKAAIAFGEGHSPLPRAPAVRFEDGRLHGVKRAVTGALGAQVALVLASRADDLVLVFAQLDDVHRSPIRSFDNSRLYGDLEFRSTPATLLAEGQEALELALRLLAEMAVVTAHEQTGGAETLLEMTCAYANSRKAFGQAVGAFQGVKHRLAELYALIEIARGNCIHAAATVSRPDLLTAAACARLSATEAYDTAARDSMQLHGAIGVTWDQGIHLHLRRARSLALEQGNAFFWEDLLAGELTGVRI